MGSLPNSYLGPRSAAAAPADARFDEVVDLAVEDGLRVADLVAGPQVLHHLVRVQDIAAHLVSPAVAAVLESVHRRLLLLAAPRKELGLEHRHRAGAVL